MVHGPDRLASEIGQLDEEEAQIFREDLGLEGSSMERVIRASYHLLGRFAQASEIAAAILFLASDDGGGCTAQSFLVDGGRF